MQGMESVTPGSFTPSIVLMSFVISVFGSWCGLTAAARARRNSGGAQWAWLFAAAASLGGAAIWSMHFIGMLAFDGHVHYALDLPMTLGSMAAAIVAAMVGMTIVTLVRGVVGYIFGGLVLGLGVCVMHYMGMYAMQMSADMVWRSGVVALSVIIAVGAATLALFFAFNLNNSWLHAAAAVVMGIGVCAMHYTGMLALRLKPDTDVLFTSSKGTDPFTLALPIFAITSVLLIGVVFAGLFFENADDRAANEMAPDLRMPEMPVPTAAPGLRLGTQSAYRAYNYPVPGTQHAAPTQTIPVQRRQVPPVPPAQPAQSGQPAPTGELPVRQPGQHQAAWAPRR